MIILAVSSGPLPLYLGGTTSKYCGEGRLADRLTGLTDNDLRKAYSFKRYCLHPKMYGWVVCFSSISYLLPYCCRTSWPLLVLRLQQYTWMLAQVPCPSGKSCPELAPYNTSPMVGTTLQVPPELGKAAMGF